MPFPFVPYPIYGYIRKLTGIPFSGATVRVTNLSTNEYEDVTTATDGSYLVDLANLPSGYTNGDLVKVRVWSNSATTQVSTSVYESGRRVDLVGWLNLSIGGSIVENVTSVEVGRSLGERVWNATVQMENKNGYRTNSFQAFNNISVGINGITVLIGRVNKIDTSRQHYIAVGGENYSAQLLDRIVQTETYTTTSIYDIITAPATGLIDKYLPFLTVTNVANDASTQTTITKTFEKQTVLECLNYLGEVASLNGYDFYVDNSQDLHFFPHKVTDSGVTLTNTGASKNIVDYQWKQQEARDLYNKVKVYYGAGGASSVERNDLDSQTDFGIREYAPITDTTVTTVAQANAVGDRILNKYSGGYREGTFQVRTTDDILNLNPGELITINIADTGISGSSFPWTFPMQFGGSTGAQYMIMQVTHRFPANRSEIRVSEYQRDLSSFFTKLVRKNY